MEDEKVPTGDTGLFSAAEALIDNCRTLGMSRDETRAIMVHPDNEKDDPGVIFDMLWPEAS